MCSEIFLVLILFLIVVLLYLIYTACAPNDKKKIDGLTKSAQEKVESTIKDVVNKLPEVNVSITPKPSTFDNNTEEVFSGDLEPFNNDLPNQKVKLDENTEYNELIQSMALDKSVKDQHKNYVNDRNKVTNTASFQPSRSDTQDVVPFIGLRRPQYSVNGVDLVDNTARTVPSELEADKLAKPTQIFWK
jgi:hypothetical protein